MACILSGCIGPDGADDKKAEIEELVGNACEMIEEEGPDFFPELREEGGEWWNGDTYIFVWQTDGLRLVYPPDTSGEGVDMSGLVDSEGKAIGELFIETATQEPYYGWVEYIWPKPDGDTPEEKHTYIKKAEYGGVEYLVGSGYYLSDTE